MKIGTKLKHILDTHGPESIALYYRNGHLLQRLKHRDGQELAPFTRIAKAVSSMTVDQSAMWVTMSRMGIMATGHYTIFDTDLIVLVGTNPAVSHVGMPVSPIPPNNPMKWVREAKNVV